MKKLLTFALLAFALALAPQIASAQNAALMPTPKLTFLDTNGVPLVGGYLYTCVAGTSCTPALPGRPAVNPLATFTDASATVANANPIILDAAGRANVWLGSGNYKLVLQDANGVTQWSQDNVSSFALKSVTTSSVTLANSVFINGTNTVGPASSLLGVFSDNFTKLLSTSSSGGVDLQNVGGLTKFRMVDAGRFLFGGTTDDGTTTVQVNSGTVSIPSLKATTGTRFLCINTSGQIVSQATACSGT